MICDCEPNEKIYGTSMVKWIKTMLRYTKAIVILGRRPKSSSKVLFRLNCLSWWPLLLCQILNWRIWSWDLQYLSLIVMLKSNWLSLDLNVDFMTLTILKLDFFSCSLNSFFTWGHHHKNFIKKHKLYVILYYIFNKF